MGTDELWWFDRLARRAITPALHLVKSEGDGLDPDYIVEVDLNPSPARDRCRLSITNRQVNKPELHGSLVILKGANDTVRVEQSFLWHNNGAPIPVVPSLNASEVTQEKITSLARGFMAKFFSRLP
jgi:hypothetical protein